MLYLLMQKADWENCRRLALAFPVEFEAYGEWYASLDQDEFFKKYGLK